VISFLVQEPELLEALRAHLARGSPLSLVSGNHDASLMAPEVRRVLIDVLRPPNESLLQVAPWFLRRHGYHLEHGHLWDPDNAPSHPLITPTIDDEPLGIALTRFVVGPSHAFGFAHAHEATPLRALLTTIRQMGPAAPLVVLRYYALAIRQCLLVTQRNVPAIMARGAQQVEKEAKAQGADAARLKRALLLRPTPRHHDEHDLFARLYLDRSIACVAVLSAPLLVFWEATVLLGILVGLLGAAYLWFSITTKHSRYGNVLVQRMLSSARALHKVLGVRGVIFAHTHVPYQRDGVANPGSFGFPDPLGRPYLLIEYDGELRSLRLLARTEASDSTEHRPLNAGNV
jgi:hypothetical protein